MHKCHKIAILGIMGINGDYQGVISRSHVSDKRSFFGAFQSFSPFFDWQNFVKRGIFTSEKTPRFTKLIFYLSKKVKKVFDLSLKLWFNTLQMSDGKAAIQEQILDIAEAASHLTILAEIDFEREENRADEQATI